MAPKIEKAKEKAETTGKKPVEEANIVTLQTNALKLLNWTADRAIFGMNKEQFDAYLAKARDKKKLETLSAKLVITKAEELNLQNTVSKSTADEKTEKAQSRYKTIVSIFENLETQNLSIVDTLNRLVMHQGAYKLESSSVLTLLTEGVGNCEARAKLMVMLVEDVFKEKLQARVQTLYLEDPVSKQLTKHVRVIAEDTEHAYILELPEVRVLLKKHTGETLPTTIFAEGYLANKDGNQWDTKIKRTDVSSTQTDSIFSLPDSSIIESGGNQNTGEENAAALRLQKLAQDPTNKKGPEAAERELGDFSYIESLTDPAIAHEIVRQLTTGKYKANMFLLTKLTTISDDCAAILGGAFYPYKTGYLPTRTKVGGERGLHASPKAFSALTKLSPDIYIRFNGDLTEEIGKSLPFAVAERSKGIVLDITGDITPEGMVQLLKNAPRNTIDLRSDKEIPRTVIEKIIAPQKEDDGHNPFDVIALSSKVGITKEDTYYFLDNYNATHDAILVNAKVVIDATLFQKALSKLQRTFKIVTFDNAEITLSSPDENRRDLILSVNECTLDMARTIAKLYKGSSVNIRTTINISNDAKMELFKTDAKHIHINGESYSQENGEWKEWPAE